MRPRSRDLPLLGQSPGKVTRPYCGVPRRTGLFLVPAWPESNRVALSVL